jgi:segregation and condensation protein A
MQHLHAPAVSVREQAELLADRLRRSHTMTFRALCGDAPDMLTTVARFLALLELFRENAVAFDQVSPLGELTVRWTAADDPDAVADFRIDEFEGSPEPEPAPAETDSASEQTPAAQEDTP